ncbi:MAG: hypothetical protein ACTHLD_13745 [Chitinophaga sp.]
MPTFTDTELQKKFCEGFSFFPFTSLKQHDTLIYKVYAGKGNLKKLLEWHSKEHDASHYRLKITKKLKHTDMPAAEDLLQLLQEARDWCAGRAFAAKLQPSGKRIAGCVDKYYHLLTTYLQEVLHPVAEQLGDKYQGAGLEHIAQMRQTMDTFLHAAGTLCGDLQQHADKKQNISQRGPGGGDREYLSRITGAMERFKTQQGRNIDLLDAWKDRQLIDDNFRSMN